MIGICLLTLVLLISGICRYFRNSSGLLPILQLPICAIPLGTWVPRIGEPTRRPLAMLRPSASLNAALNLLIQGVLAFLSINDFLNWWQLEICYLKIFCWRKHYILFALIIFSYYFSWENKNPLLFELLQFCCQRVSQRKGKVDAPELGDTSFEHDNLFSLSRLYYLERWISN